MSGLIFFFLISSLGVLAQSPLPPWDNQLYDFGWDPYGPSIEQCSTRNITWSTRRTADPQPTAPYTIYVLASGHEPHIIATTEDTFYFWTVGTLAGAPGRYILYIEDANGYTGGTSLMFDITPSDDADCPDESPQTSELTSVVEGSQAFHVNGSPDQCDELRMVVTGGTAPYKFQTLAAQRPPKTTTWTTDTMVYTVDLAPTEEFFLLATDATGKTATQGPFTVNAGSDSCFEVASTVRVGEMSTTYSFNPQTFQAPSNTKSADGGQNTEGGDGGDGNNFSSSSNTGIIVGAVFGGLFVISLIVGVFLFLRRRRRKQYRRAQLDLDKDPTENTGFVSPTNAPFVSPFPYSTTTSTNIPPALAYYDHPVNTSDDQSRAASMVSSIPTGYYPAGSQDFLAAGQRAHSISNSTGTKPSISSQGSTLPLLPTNTGQRGVSSVPTQPSGPSSRLVAVNPSSPISETHEKQGLLEREVLQNQQEAAGAGLRRAPTAPPPYTLQS